MKKIIAIVLACICVLGIVGCSQQPQQVQGGQLLAEGNVINIDVSSLPEGYNYSFSGADAKAIIDYLSTLNLESNFEENPNEYDGMTWVISLKYENGDTLTIYHFGNMFIRVKGGSWYKMTYDEASRFDTLLDELK
jgi:hypothetical protein